MSSRLPLPLSENDAYGSDKGLAMQPSFKPQSALHIEGEWRRFATTNNKKTLPAHKKPALVRGTRICTHAIHTHWSN